MASIYSVECSNTGVITGQLLPCPAELQKAVEFIASDFESSLLFQQAVSKEIPVKISFQSDFFDNEFARYCYGNNTISLSSQLQGRTIDQIIPYLVFELNNAQQSSQFKEIDEKCIEFGMEETVRRIEQCEYKSALETNRLIHKWITQGKLPNTTAFSRVFPNFRDHYLYQQISSHSQQIADRYYKRFSSCYQGTWKASPSQDEIPLLKCLLELKLLKAEGTLEESKLAEAKIEKFVARVQSIVDKKLDSSAGRNLLENVLYVLQPE